MDIEYGKGETRFGTGVQITMSRNEVAVAIDAYLTAHGANISGPRTVILNNKLIEDCKIYVDPSGVVIANGVRYLGSGISLRKCK